MDSKAYRSKIKKDCTKFRAFRQIWTLCVLFVLCKKPFSSVNDGFFFPFFLFNFLISFLFSSVNVTGRKGNFQVSESLQGGVGIRTKRNCAQVVKFDRRLLAGFFCQPAHLWRFSGRAVTPIGNLPVGWKWRDFVGWNEITSLNKGVIF